MGAEEQEEAAAPLEAKKQQKTSKDVYFCVLPDKYEPLIEEGEEEDEGGEERRRRKEEKKRKRKKRCKKCRKNICKALRYTWRILLAGVQSMASAYSTPLSAMPTVVMEMRRPGDSMA
ncbi:protein PXR1-like [Poecilia latipinna]|uniref:protein PXR1-like n=1 Tax=Poecilia latipinna TaxID=48699 RepID=UPI00072DF889|nr:PREDICTED: protein PXR1-like [Poecilia latipinna]